MSIYETMVGIQSKLRNLLLAVVTAPCINLEQPLQILDSQAYLRHVDLQLLTEIKC